MDDLVKIGDPVPNFTTRGNLSSISVHCEHKGLREHRELKSADPVVLQNKVETLLVRWEEKWLKAQLQSARIGSAQAAEVATLEAQKCLLEVDSVLKHTLTVDDRVDWDLLKRHPPFHWQRKATARIKYKADGEPVGSDPEVPQPPPDPAKFKPELGFFEYILPFLRKKKEDDARGRLDAAENAHQRAFSILNGRNAALAKQLVEEKIAFQKARSEYDDAQVEAAEKVETLRRGWTQKQVESVEEHAQLVLDSSEFPDWFSYDFEVAFDREAGMLVVDYQLPPPDSIPTLERVTYVKSRNETTEKRITEAKARAAFDSVCYQTALRRIHELFEADEVDALASITFNGWVEATNKATGRLERNCILSVQATKAEFLTFDLAKVDPKACFQSLRGVAASSLSHLAAVRPILKLDRADARFVASQDVADSLNESTNLATMSWEDFEHLVRELFGKIFSGPGAEVRVTQASRDGGVDAIALDPDPIKGGKIVIQAKRYSGTVGVGYVRDLYGTVLNEGANRGILVTTSTYGPDAYKFANGKPLTLINGSNLLSLLADHGHKARIDLAEAKRVLRDERRGES